MTLEQQYSPRLLRVGRALDDALRERPPQRTPAPNARPAAVLMPLWDDGDDVQVVFTKRNADLPTHAGQISFPGGMAERGDEGLSQTALRETYEEIGVPPEQVQVVARWDQLVTITNFLVTPYLGLISDHTRFVPNRAEVERLLMVPLLKVLDRGQWKDTEVTWQGMTFPQVALDHGGDRIWGATAKMLLSLIKALGPDLARVAGALDGRGPAAKRHR